MLVQDTIPLITPSVKKVIVDLNQILDLQYCLGLLGEMICSPPVIRLHYFSYIRTHPVSRSIYCILFHFFLSPSSSSSIYLSSHPISPSATPPHQPRLPSPSSCTSPSSSVIDSRWHSYKVQSWTITTTTQMILRDTPPEATEAGTYFSPSR